MDTWRAGKRVALLVLGVSLWASAVTAQDWVEGVRLKPGGVGTDVTMVLAVLGGIVLLLVILKVANRLARLPMPASTRAQEVRRVSSDFGRQASRMGFRVAEIKTLRLITGKLAPQHADELLALEEGRERLRDSIEKRIRRREREIEHLRGILQKLRVVRERALHERASVRVEANLPVYVVRKQQTPEGVEDDEGLYSDIDQVSGHMLDLSEGGAAVSAELNAAPQDLVELWSADSEVWIPPMTATVLQVERQGAKAPVLHMRFLDPPMAELRAAIQALQRQAGPER